MMPETAEARRHLTLVHDEEPRIEDELVDEEYGMPLMREHGLGYREQVRRVICDPLEDEL